MFDEILKEAEVAAKRAELDTLKPYGGKEPNHMECGFAWVHVKDARIPFVRHLKKKIKEAGVKYDSAGNLINLDWSCNRETLVSLGIESYGSPHWKKGWEFWNPSNYNDQWMTPKYNAAIAFAEVLNSYGIECSAGCRYD